MAELRDPAGIVALAAAGLAVACLVATLLLAARLRRLRNEQSAVLGDGRREDLVTHAARLERAFAGLSQGVEETTRRLDERMSAVEERVDATVAHRALVRYDAYGELAGKQSLSLALLDARRNGVVLSSITHRDTARLYCKPIFDGDGEQPLSPEEQEAVRLALAGHMQSRTLDQ